MEYDLIDQAPIPIQPHGVLLGFDETGSIVRIAGDTRRLLGAEPEALLGSQATGLAGTSVGRWIGLVLDRAGASTGYLGTWNPPTPGEGVWDATAHRASGRMILEFEPAPPERQSAAEGLAALGRAFAALDSPDDLAALCAAAVGEVRRLTGFDRAVLCRLAEDGAGIIIAENGNGTMPGLSSPCPDTCELTCLVDASCLHGVSFIADVDGRPAPLLGSPEPGTSSARDISGCHLLGASAACLQQLRNLGAAAAMSLPLVVDGRTWGAIACHHHAPRLLACELRESCTQLGRVLSQEIARREASEHRRESARLHERRTALLSELRHARDAAGHLCPDIHTLAGAIPSHGVALVSREHAMLAGQTPSERQVLELAGWLGEQLERGAYATNRLGEQFEPATAYAATVSGVLAATTGGEHSLMLLWFRAEQAGEQACADDCSAATFTQRHERRRGKARAWTKAQIDAASQLARALGELAQQQTLRELNNRLREALAEQQSLVAEKNLLLQEVHHRVQNGLQIVNSMLQLQARQAPDPQVRAQFDGAVTRLLAIGAVHRHLWQSGEAERVQLGRYLRQLCDDLMLSWGEEWSGRLSVDALDVALPSQTAVTLALVVTELLTNAVKYAYGGAPGPIAVRVDAVGAHLEVIVSDGGRGMTEASPGEGLGSKLIRIFTAQLDGEIETASGDDGTTVTLRIPLPPGLMTGVRTAAAADAQ